MDKKLVILVIVTALSIFLVGCDDISIVDGEPVSKVQTELGKEVLRLSYGNDTLQCVAFEEECIADIDCCKGYMCSQNECVEPPSICRYHLLSSGFGVLGFVLIFLSITGQSFIGLWISQVFAKIGYRKIPFFVMILLGLASLIASIILSGFC